MLSELITALCSRMDLPVLTPDAQGGYTLDFPDGFTVRFLVMREHLALSGTVCALPEGADAKDALCRELLTLSLGRASRECKKALPHLALHATDLVLLQRYPAELSQEAFDAAVEGFLNLLEKWAALAVKERQQAL